MLKIIYYTRFLVYVITFKVGGRYYNPSRANPNQVTHTVGPSAPSTGSGKIFLSTVFKPTEIGVAVSVVVTNESYLREYQTWSNGKICKGLSGMFLSQEDTLFESFIGHAFNLQEVKAPLQEGWITFSCRPVDPSKSDIVILFHILLMFSWAVNL
jgi:hypothetical protein